MNSRANSPDWICLFWGVLLNQSVIVPLNLQSTPDMVQQIATQSGAKMFFRYHGYRAELPVGPGVGCCVVPPVLSYSYRLV